MNTTSIIGRIAMVTALHLCLSPVVFAEDTKPAPSQPKDKPAKEAAAACAEHGVKKTICTRCNPKLEPVFRAKGDWCEEHTRPESQCSLCHPDLKKKGIK